MAKGDIYSRYAKGSSRPRSSSRRSGRQDIYSKYAASTKPEKKGGGPSVFSRVMDLLSRGSYMVNEAQRRGSLPEGQTEGQIGARKGMDQFNTDALKGAWAGLSGKRKTSAQELVGELGITQGTNNRVARGAEGLFYDIFADPTTYLGFGVVKAPLKAKKALDSLDSAADAGKAAKSLTKATEKAVDAVEAADKATAVAQTAKPSRKVSDIIAEASSKSQKSTPPKNPEEIKALQMIREVMSASGRKLSDELVAMLADIPPVTTKTGKVNKGATAAKILSAEKKAEKAQAAAKAATKPPSPVGLGLGPIPGKAISGGRKAGVAGKLVAALDEAAQPSLFDDALDVGRADLPPPKMAPEAVPGPPKAVVDDTPGLAGLTDAGAPISRALELRIAGHGVLRSEKAYEALAKPLRAVGVSDIGQGVSRTFRTGHALLPEVHNLQRIFSGQGRQAVADKADEIHKIMSGGDDAAGVSYPRVNKDGQKQIYAAIQDGADAVDALPPELKIPAQYMQVEIAKLNDLGRRTDQNLLDLDMPVNAAAARNAKFEPIPKYKGAKKSDGTPDTFDRAPQAFIAQYDRAVRKAYFEKFADEVAKRFPDKSAEMMGNIKKAREVFGVDGEVSVAWRHHMDMVQGHWKRWVTQYRPGFHVRNMIGDSFNAYLAGTAPQRFKDAGIVLAKNMGDTPKAGGRIKMGNRTFSAEEVESLYRRGGLETSFIETEVIGASRRKISHLITEGSQQREKYVRMATFIDSMDKALKRGVSVQKAVEEAAFRVRKYHFDYTDLTPSERKLRTFIPFYTYSRKELPLLLEHTLTSPGKIVAPQKLGGAIETMLGVDKGDPDDPFPGIDGLMPEYMKDQQVIQRGNNKVFTPGLPTDMLGMMGPRSFVRTQAGNVTPLIKGPLELGTGKSFPLGYSLRKKDQSEEEMLARYLAAYLPYGNLARDSESPLSERLLNMLTGVGAKTVRG